MFSEALGEADEEAKHLAEVKINESTDRTDSPAAPMLLTLYC